MGGKEKETENMRKREKGKQRKHRKDREQGRVFLCITSGCKQTYLHDMLFGLFPCPCYRDAEGKD